MIRIAIAALALLALALTVQSATIATAEAFAEVIKATQAE